MWVLCLHICLCTVRMPGVCRGKKRALVPPELEIQMVVNLNVGAGNPACSFGPNCSSHSPHLSVTAPTLRASRRFSHYRSSTSTLRHCQARHSAFQYAYRSASLPRSPMCTLNTPLKYIWPPGLLLLYLCLTQRRFLNLKTRIFSSFSI